MDHVHNLAKPNLLSDLTQVSLRGVFRLVLLYIFFPILGIALILLFIDLISQSRIEKIQKQIQQIDASIIVGVTSESFNQSTLDPCSSDAISRTRVAQGIKVQAMREGKQCSWKYLAAGQIIAEDYWGTNYQLEMRRYHSQDTILAEDTFHPQDNDCFKQRKFFDDRGRVFIEECYSEGGVAHGKCYRIIGRDCMERRNSTRSPIPPMLNWFLYR